MLIFGHAGITLGAAVVLDGILNKHHSLFSLQNKLKEWRQSFPQAQPAPGHSPDNVKSWFILLAKHIDVRLLLAGSLLPDIIDKPVGQVFFKSIFSNGRIFSHTLVFLFIITIAGLYLYGRRGKLWLLVLSFGTFAHLLQDQIWLYPKTIFWPLYGFAFERIDLSGWAGGILRALLTKPSVYIPELIGVSILIWFTVALARKRKISAFIRKGQIV